MKNTEQNAQNDLSNMTGKEVFDMMVGTYHHHIKNKLVIIQAEMDVKSGGQEAVDALIKLLKDIEENNLETVQYCKESNSKILDYKK